MPNDPLAPSLDDIASMTHGQPTQPPAPPIYQSPLRNQFNQGGLMGLLTDNGILPQSWKDNWLNRLVHSQAFEDASQFAGGGFGAIRAFHGSPHNFDRFDMSKIGTGEGAQVYGHGLYFAEEPKTAESYRNMRRQLGTMYQVDINADPEDFLHWDKPLSEQSQKVQDYVKQLREDPEFSRWFRLHKEMHGDKEMTGQKLYSSLAMSKDPNWKRIEGDRSAAAEELRKAGIPGIKYLDQGSRRMSDEQIDAEIARIQKTIHPNMTPVERQIADSMTKNLKEQRGRPQTHNFVVFNDELINIIKKYGLAGLIAGGAAHYSAPDGSQ